MDIAIIGATGLVGREIIKVLQERDHFSKSEIIFVASQSKTKRKIKFYNKEYKVVNINDAIKKSQNTYYFQQGQKLQKNMQQNLKKQVQ